MAEISIVKISALPVAEQIGDEDLLALAQDGATKALAYGTIKDDISEELAPDATLSEAGKAADAKAVGDALALKADKTVVTAEVNRIDAALNTKANTNDVNAAMDTKANADEVTAALALKADTATVNAGLALKADKTELTAGLATKQNVLTFDGTPTQGSTNPVTSGGVFNAIPAIDNTLTVAGDAADAKATGGKITELKSATDELKNDITNIGATLLDGSEPIEIGAIYTDFQSGGLQDLDFWADQKYRCTNYNLHTAPIDIQLSIASGFFAGWSYAKDDGATFEAFSGWKTGSAVIPKGTVFRLEITRTNEVKSEISNVEEFTNAVLVTNHTLKTAIDPLMYRNLIGTEIGVLYPVHIPIGSYITVSTSDGSNFTGGEVYLYDINKTLMASIFLTTNVAYRTVYAQSGLTGDIYYISFTKAQTEYLQVEIGSSRSQFQSYVPNYEVVKDMAIDAQFDKATTSYYSDDKEKTTTSHSVRTVLNGRRYGQYAEVVFDGKTSSSGIVSITAYENDAAGMYGIDVPVTKSYYQPFRVRLPLFEKDMSVRISTNSTVTIKNVEARIISDGFEIDTDGFYIAHRGGSCYRVPENTMEAFAMAKRLGYTRFETDLQRTSDGKWILLHDNTIDRVSNGTGNAYEMTYSQLLQYDFGDYIKGRYTNTPVCLLSECLDFCKETGMKPLLEIKVGNGVTFTSAYASEVAAIINEAGMADNVDFVSFSFDGLAAMAGVMPNARYYFNGTPTEDHIKRLKAIADNVVMSINDVESLDDAIDACKEADLPFIYSTNSLTDIKTCVKNGAIGVCTDFVNLTGCYW